MLESSNLFLAESYSEIVRNSLHFAETFATSSELWNISLSKKLLIGIITYFYAWSKFKINSKWQNIHFYLRMHWLEVSKHPFHF